MKTRIEHTQQKITSRWMDGWMDERMDGRIDGILS